MVVGSKIIAQSLSNGIQLFLLVFTKIRLFIEYRYVSMWFEKKDRTT